MPKTHQASAEMVSHTSAVLHSSAVLPTHTHQLQTFLEALHSFENLFLWENMHIDRDGEWIRESLCHLTILIAHDGSFMQEESLDTCSTTVIMHCSSSNQRAKISVAERLESAKKFCGKLLGAVIIQYILWAAAADLPGVLGLVCLYCDSHGVIAHGNLLRKVLLDKQAQSNLIFLLKYLVGSITLQPHWVWVKGHVVKSRGWQQCSLAKKMNYYADELAKHALLSAISGGHVIARDYPLKPIKVLLSGTKVTWSPWLALEKHWGIRLPRTCPMRNRSFRSPIFTWYGGKRSRR
jgi:hypothetical protein